MFKNLIIAVLVAIIVTWCFGEVISDWGHVMVSVGDEHLSGITGWISFAVVGVIMLLLGFFLAISMLGVLLFVACVVVGTIFVAGAASLWPVVLMAIVIIWLVKDRKEVTD
ncbi:hypothetical protein [Neptunicella sp. SCSIO 80796]|uniref:hypothetical protein n=1 Tax=Neptunicella plasticusilytica TaxID=3117012 RepID=UPI003A4D5E7D